MSIRIQRCAASSFNARCTAETLNPDRAARTSASVRITRWQASAANTKKTTRASLESARYPGCNGRSGRITPSGGTPIPSGQAAASSHARCNAPTSLPNISRKMSDTALTRATSRISFSLRSVSLNMRVAASRLCSSAVSSANSSGTARSDGTHVVRASTHIAMTTAAAGDSCVWRPPRSSHAVQQLTSVVGSPTSVISTFVGTLPDRRIPRVYGFSTACAHDHAHFLHAYFLRALCATNRTQCRYEQRRALISCDSSGVKRISAAQFASNSSRTCVDFSSATDSGSGLKGAVKGINLNLSNPNTVTTAVAGAILAVYTLNLNNSTSPSFTTYSFPSDRTSPFSRASFQPRCLTNASNATVSALMNPRSKSV